MSFKTFDLASDVTKLQTAIHEVVAISSSLFSVDANIKMFKNIASASSANDLGGYFQTLYDASPTSSLSSDLLDVTYGYATGSAYNVPVTATASQNEKIKIYRIFADRLLGHPDDVFSINSADQEEAIFVLPKRNIQKDEIKKGSVSIILNRNGEQVTASDAGAAGNFKQTVGGDYAPLKYNGTGSEVGQVWYQAGVVVLPPNLAWPSEGSALWSGSVKLVNIQPSGTINQVVDGFRRHVERIDFHNQTNLYSTIFFCYGNHSEFNYSSNPTFVDENKRIRPTSGSSAAQTRTYVTTIGLYDPSDNLLGVGKLNKPVMKGPDNVCAFRLRIDY
jgi:hypothetical protein